MVSPSFYPSFTPRDARSSEIAAIAAIYAHHVRTGFGTFEEEPPTPAEMRRRYDHVVALGLPFLVAVRNDEVLGYAYAAPYRPRSAYRHTVEDSLYVAPEAQRQGIGAALLRTIIDRCAAFGLRQMVAVIGDSGNLASINAHEKCGFRRVGVLTDVGFKQSRWLDTVIMQRAL